jgi:ABC-type nickel/cobalt efflux system permease component RcnA
VTATHTAAVYLLGFVTLVAAGFIAPERLYVYLGVASGAIILLMGLALAFGRLRRLTRGSSKETGAAHRHGPFGRAHSHAPVPVSVLRAEAVGAPGVALTVAMPGHSHDHDHDHAAGHHDHGHEAQAAALDGRSAPGWRSLISLGVAGGLIPCPSAIIVMLAAISIGQVLYGMLLIVAFSLGLAGVLTAIGIALVAGKRLTERSRVRGALERPAVALGLRAIPVLSACAIAVVGAVLTYQAWDRV